MWRGFIRFHRNSAFEAASYACGALLELHILFSSISLNATTSPWRIRRQTLSPTSKVWSMRKRERERKLNICRVCRPCCCCWWLRGQADRQAGRQTSERASDRLASVSVCRLPGSLVVQPALRQACSCPGVTCLQASKQASKQAGRQAGTHKRILRTPHQRTLLIAGSIHTVCAYRIPPTNRRTTSQ